MNTDWLDTHGFIEFGSDPAYRYFIFRSYHRANTLIHSQTYHVAIHLESMIGGENWQSSDHAVCYFDECDWPDINVIESVKQYPQCTLDEFRQQQNTESFYVKHILPVAFLNTVGECVSCGRRYIIDYLTNDEYREAQFAINRSNGLKEYLQVVALHSKCLAHQNGTYGRCAWCKRDHPHDVWWKLREAKKDPEHEHSYYDALLDSVLEAKLLIRYSTAGRKLAKVCAARYLRKHRSRLTQGQQDFFRMIAGAEAIKKYQQGGTHEHERSSQQ